MGAGVDYLCEVLSQLGAAQRAVKPRLGVVTGRVDNGPRRPSIPSTRTSANPASATSCCS